MLHMDYIENALPYPLLDPSENDFPPPISPQSFYSGTSLERLFLQGVGRVTLGDSRSQEDTKVLPRLDHGPGSRSLEDTKTLQGLVR